MSSKTYSQRYSLNPESDRKKIVVINEYERNAAVRRAFEDWTRIWSSFDSEKESHHEYFGEYFGEKGALIIDTKLKDGNDIEVHSVTPEGLVKLVKKLGLPHPLLPIEN